MRPLAVVSRKASGAVALARAYWNVLRFPRASRGRRHDLPAPLIVSLTSFALRFPSLHLTLKSMLTQSVLPDMTILWVSERDFAQLPASVLDLRAHGLTIEVCEDMRSYTKIVPALRRYPDAFILTVDDDVYYPPDLIAQLTAGHDPALPAIVCRRGHGIKRDADRRMRPYLEWAGNVPDDTPASAHSADLFPTGHGGVLYPPRSLHPDVTEAALFRALAPTADDLWLYWMGRRAGSLYRKVGGPYRTISWLGSQKATLHQINNGADENTTQIKRLEAHFGPV